MGVKVTGVLRWMVVAAIISASLPGCGGGGGSSGGTSGGSSGTGSPGGTGGTTLTYTIGGNLVGLAAGASVTLLDNNGDPLPLAANGTFTFATPLPTNATYSVTVGTQPTNGQQCKVISGSSGTVSNSNVTSVSVACANTVGGYVVGLAGGQSVTLQDNGGDNLTLSANGPFTFATPLYAPSTYSVTVLTNPANGQVCTVMPNALGSSGSGTISGANVVNVRVSCASTFTFAGTGVQGEGDATGEEAAFSSPSGAAFDSAGNLYVVDSWIASGASATLSTSAVRKISPAGVVTTLAKLPAPVAVTVPAGISGLAGIAVDSSNNVYVADSSHYRILKITSAGAVSVFAGSGTPGYLDATGTAAQFNFPEGVAVDSTGNVYVGDAGNNMIRKITPGGTVSTLAGQLTSGYLDGTGTAAQFYGPSGVAVDASGNVYVADFGNSRIRKITSAGVVTTLSGGATVPGFGLTLMDGPGTAAAFYWPVAVGLDASGNVYVTDGNNQSIRMITPTGVTSTLAGNLHVFNYSDGTANKAVFMYQLGGVAVDGSGNVYVADGGNNRIRKISAAPYTYTVGGHLVGLANAASITLTNNGTDTLTLSANGAFTFAGKLSDITGAASYNVAISSQPAGQTCAVVNGAGGFTNGDVRTVTVNCATVSTFAGQTTSGMLNGTGTAAQFNSPEGVAVDSLGNVYVADTLNFVIRKITPAGVVSTFAGGGGGGAAGLTNGTGTAAQFNSPQGVATDSSNNVYVADTFNCAIRKITPTAVVSTLAGTGVCGYLDGSGTTAQFFYPTNLVWDKTTGNLYVADWYNYRIRVVSSTGVVSTLAGSGTSGSVDGTGTLAGFGSWLKGLALDGAGNLYVADGALIRKIAISTAVVTTWAGGASTPGIIDGVGSGASFGSAQSMTFDASGRLYVADNYGNIRVVVPNATGTQGVVSTLAGSASFVAPTPANGNGSVATFCPCNAGPYGVAFDAISGSVYVGDGGDNMIRKIVP